MPLPKLNTDFLWSIRLGAQLRVLSYGEPYRYYYGPYNEFEQTSAYVRTIPCGPGQCVLCNPDTNGRSQFWTLPTTELEKQIQDGKLILNGIPKNWERLKRDADIATR